MLCLKDTIDLLQITSEASQKKNSNKKKRLNSKKNVLKYVISNSAKNIVLKDRKVVRWLLRRATNEIISNFEFQKGKT